MLGGFLPVRVSFLDKQCWGPCMNIELPENGDLDRMQQEDPECAQGTGKAGGTSQLSIKGQSDGYVETMMGCCLLWKEEMTTA